MNKLPNGQCVCPQGNVYFNGQCVPPQQCPPGSITLPGGVCWCPLGMIFGNGVCQPPPICGPNQDLWNGQCLPKCHAQPGPHAAERRLRPRHHPAAAALLPAEQGDLERPVRRKVQFQRVPQAAERRLHAVPGSAAGLLPAVEGDLERAVPRQVPGRSGSQAAERRLRSADHPAADQPGASRAPLQPNKEMWNGQCVAKCTGNNVHLPPDGHCGPQLFQPLQSTRLPARCREGDVERPVRRSAPATMSTCRPTAIAASSVQPPLQSTRLPARCRARRCGTASASPSAPATTSTCRPTATAGRSWSSSRRSRIKPPVQLNPGPRVRACRARRCGTASAWPSAPATTSTCRPTATAGRSWCSRRSRSSRFCRVQVMGAQDRCRDRTLPGPLPGNGGAGGARRTTAADPAGTRTAPAQGAPGATEAQEGCNSSRSNRSSRRRPDPARAGTGHPAGAGATTAARRPGRVRRGQGTVSRRLRGRVSGGPGARWPAGDCAAMPRTDRPASPLICAQPPMTAACGPRRAGSRRVRGTVAWPKARLHRWLPPHGIRAAERRALRARRGAGLRRAT